MELTIIKIVISIAVVVLLAEVSKRVNPLLGGLLSGLPLGVGLSVYFISYTEGIEFVIKGVPWGISGLAAAIVFCFFYLLGGKIVKTNNKIVSILFSCTLGFASFFLSGYLIYMMKLNLLTSIIIFTGVFILNIAVIRKIKIEESTDNGKKSKDSLMSILIRGVIVGIIIVAVTGTASIVGERWAGILSSFPSILFSLVLVLHYEEGNSLYPHVLYGFSYSVSILALFYILCLYFLPKFGLNFGFVLVYAVCLLFVFAMKIVPEKLRASK